MVKRILSLFSKEIDGLHEAAYLLAAATVASQILALVRDRLLAYYFGAGHTLDLYYASFRISDIIYATIASMVAASVLVPFLIKKCNVNEEQKAKAAGLVVTEQGRAEARHFIDHTFSVFFLAIIAVSVVIFILMPYIIPRLLPGYANDPESIHQIIIASRIMLLSPIFLGISNFLASITQMYNRFLIYAISPLLYNIGIIFGTIFLYPIFGLYGLVGGVILGTAMHMGIQIPFVASKGLFPRIHLNIDWKEVKQVVLVSFPRTLTLSSTEIAELFLIALATFMGTGAISIFNFSFNLQSVPLAVIGVSYASAAFSNLAKFYESGDMKRYIEYMATSVKHIIFWSMPVTVLFIVLRAQIVRTILGSGQFTWADTRLTAAMLALFTISVVGQSLILLFVRAYYAEGKTRRPLIANMASAAAIIISAFVLEWMFTAWPAFAIFMESLFKVQDLNSTTDAIVLTLALAYSLGNILNAYLHWHMFKTDHKQHADFKTTFTRPIFKTTFDSLGASIIGGYAAFLGLQVMAHFVNQQKVFGVFFQGFVGGIAGIAVWLLVLWILRSKELKDVWVTFHKKFWKVASVSTADAEPL
jgi:putative peptidoglycan lipid II flippase